MKFIINAQKIIHETLDGEPVIINLNNGYYYSIDKSGRDIWECIERGFSAEMMVEELVRRYQGSAGQMHEFVHKFLSALQKEDLILTEDVPQTEGMEIATYSSSAVLRETAGTVFEPPVLHKYTDMQGLLLLDPIHEVDEAGWPHTNPAAK